MAQFWVQLVGCVYLAARSCGGVSLARLDAGQQDLPTGMETSEAAQARLQEMLDVAAKARSGPELLAKMRELQAAIQAAEIEGKLQLEYSFGDEDIDVDTPSRPGRIRKHYPNKLLPGQVPIPEEPPPELKPNQPSPLRSIWDLPASRKAPEKEDEDESGVRCTHDDINNFNIKVISERAYLNKTIARMSARGQDMMSIMKMGIETVFGKDCEWENFWAPQKAPWPKFNGCLQRQYVISQPCASCFTQFGRDAVGTSLRNAGCMFECVPIMGCNTTTKDNLDDCIDLELTCVRCLEPAARDLINCFNSTDKLELLDMVDKTMEVFEDGRLADAVWNGTSRHLLGTILKKKDGHTPNDVPLDGSSPGFVFNE